MKRKGICLSCFIIIVILLCLKIYRDTEHQEADLDNWIGEYKYVERGCCKDGTVGEVYYQIIIWEQNQNYYAIIQDDDYLSGFSGKQVWSFAAVSGDENKISFTFLQTLARDDLYGIRQRYTEGEILLQFERVGGKILTGWKALRDQNPNLPQTGEMIVGSYFEKEGNYGKE